MRLSTMSLFPLFRVLVAAFSIARTIGVCSAEESAVKQIDAGPFSVKAPVEWSGGIIVEKVPFQPLYRPSEWAELQAAKLSKAPAPPFLKPGYSTRPEHWAIRFPKLALPGSDYDPKNAGDDSEAPQILIHKAAQWSGAFTDGRQNEADVKKISKKLRRSLEEMDPTGDPAYMDAELHFVSAKKKIQFKGGFGFRVLAQWTIEPDLVRQGRLHYLFLGMSDDNSCQIIATFPIEIPGLSVDRDVKAEHLGFSVSRYAALSKDFSKYDRAAKEWISKNAEQSNPALKRLDTMMESLVVAKWP